MAKGEITSADDGTNLTAVTNKGGGNFVLSVGGGTTIAAQVEKYTNDSWVSTGSDGTISDTFYKVIEAAPGDQFRIAVTTATGTWDYEFKEQLLK